MRRRCAASSIAGERRGTREGDQRRGEEGRRLRVAGGEEEG